MEKTLVGRDDELKILKELLASPEPELLAVYGRRRIGKTYLISEFFKNKGVYFEITGTKGGTMAEQLFHFAYEFSRQFHKQISPPKSWGEALSILHDEVEKTPNGQKIILFFDEVPWLASPRSKFLNALEHFWNRYLSRNKNVIMVICGSSASWVIKNIINNKGGLHGRVTRKMRLLPFSLSDTEKYLRSRHIELDRKQIIDLYMALGGVPKYLSYVTRGKSAAQIINDVLFSIQGGMYEEFDNLYSSLFDHSQHHISIVKALSKASEGLTHEEILQSAKLASGGFSSKILEELIDAGFIVYVPTFTKNKRGGIYRLVDEYSIFYLTWIADEPKIGLQSSDAGYWMKKYGSHKWSAWSGTAFEALCLKHIGKIKQALGIFGVSTSESGWRYLPKKGSNQQGAQIDLLIDRADGCMNLCEMKYSDSEFVIDKPYAEALRRKKNIFRERTQTKKTLFTTLVTTYGVRKNSHCLSEVDCQLTMDDLFL